jgi:hypothetical protein
MAHAAISREGRGRRVSLMNGTKIGAAEVLLVACRAIDGSFGPSVLTRATMALGAVGEHVHSREREARHAVDLQRTRRLPTDRRVTVVAGSRETSSMKVVVTAHACALDGGAARCVVTRDARGVHVLSRQREACRRVIELHFLARATLRAPRRRRVTRAAWNGVREAPSCRCARRCW